MTLYGAIRGAVWQAASLGSVALSVYVALKFSVSLAPIFSKQEPWNRFVAMLVLYIVTSVAVWMVFRLVSELIDKIKLHQFDRQLGAILGLAKGVLFALLITFFAVTLAETSRQVVLKARSGHFASVFIHKAVPLLPDDVRAALGKYIDEFDEKLDPNAPPGADDPLKAGLREAKDKIIKDIGNRAGEVIGGQKTK
jgi:membrane protein required for colicin V production